MKKNSNNVVLKLYMLFFQSSITIRVKFSKYSKYKTIKLICILNFLQLYNKSLYFLIVKESKSLIILHR